MQTFARHVSVRDFSKQILHVIDSLITDFAQLARGCLGCSSCEIECTSECTVRLYDTPPFVIASSSVSTREFELEYSRVRERAFTLAI